MNGFLLIDKEKGWTSFDVIRKLRGILHEKSIGHAGTLDPLATGLLIVGIGEGTKLLEYFIGMDKEYEVVAKFGYVSDTYDAEGKITENSAKVLSTVLSFRPAWRRDYRLTSGAFTEFSDITDSGLKFSKKEILAKINDSFLGKISQIPPKYSALKINGKKACDIVRAGGDVDLKPRKVSIYSFDILDFKWPKVSFKVKCSSGTYIRSLIHDLGCKLGCGGYVEELRRNKVGEFSVLDSIKLEELNKKVEQGKGFEGCGILSLEEIGRKFPFIDLTSDEFDGLKDGKILKNRKVEQNVPVFAFCSEKLVGIVENSKDGVGIKFKKRIFSKL